jgi:hypothetical protein
MSCHFLPLALVASGDSEAEDDSSVSCGDGVGVNLDWGVEVPDEEVYTKGEAKKPPPPPAWFHLQPPCWLLSDFSPVL